tara:strand:+ start:1470 stop:1616 length:147 start_codon:yes stop_codon:yes gene_type:complete
MNERAVAIIWKVCNFFLMPESYNLVINSYHNLIIKIIENPKEKKVEAK